MKKIIILLFGYCLSSNLSAQDGTLVLQDSTAPKIQYGYMAFGETTLRWNELYPFVFNGLTLNTSTSLVQLVFDTTRFKNKLKPWVYYQSIGGGSFVDSIWRVAGKDSVFWRRGGITFAQLDSVGSGGGGGSPGGPDKSFQYNSSSTLTGSGNLSQETNYVKVLGTSTSVTPLQVYGMTGQTSSLIKAISAAGDSVFTVQNNGDTRIGNSTGARYSRRVEMLLAIASTVTDGLFLTDNANGPSVGLRPSTGDFLAITGGGVAMSAWKNLNTGNTFTTGPYGFYVSGDNLGIGVSPNGGYLHIKAGTTAASTAPIKLTSGTLMTAIEVGAGEYNNDYYLSNSASNRLAVGGAIKDFVADSSNSGTGETDAYAYSIKANTLNADGAKICADYTVNLTDITATAQVKVIFGATTLANTGALTVSATGTVTISLKFIRTSSTTARASVTMLSPTGSTVVYTSETDLTSQDFTIANILKLTLTAAGAGGGSGDLVAKHGAVFYWPASNN